jgi:murein DD-endopeptidase MepM/ murein hydrolase activator NlpD
MQRNHVRRTALVVAVLSAVGAIAASAGATPGSTGGTLANTGVTGASGATGPTGASGASAGAGATGATGSTGATGATGQAGATGASGASGPSSPAGQGTPTTPAGPTGATGATSPSGAGLTPGTGTSGSHKKRHRHHHHVAGSSSTPVIVGTASQPFSNAGSAAGRHHHGHSGGSSSSGPVAPPPSLFDGANPLAGVLPGSWDDPFIVAGGVNVPQFYVQSFHVPPFLLPIYQAAGAAYGIPWQTLAAINEVETDYGTNLDTSSAGAIGWMQFLPSTWKRYGVDASASGARDPYNAADAIFAAARYLAAAGGAHNLPRAIFAYNHSHAYVQSVLDRAELLSGEPSALVDSVTDLAEGDFPIQLGYHASYRAASVPSAGATAGAATASRSGTAPAPSAVGAAAAAGVRRAPSADIFAASGAAVVSAQDGTVVAIGHSRTLGRYVVVRNAFGARFTYANLASVSAWYPTPKPPRPSAQILSAAVPTALAPGPRPTRAPASAGAQPSHKAPPKTLFLTKRHARRAKAAAAQSSGPLIATVNLRSNPTALPTFTPLSVLDRALRPRTHAAARRAARTALLARYFTGAFGLHPDQLELARLRVGSHVLAGTILGRLARTHGAREAHLVFELRPAGSGQPLIDPRPFLDAWSQLETLELHRDTFAGAPYYGPNLHASSVGTVLASSQTDLERIVLQDTHVTLAACERSAIADGAVDRRVLATLEVLALHGIDPTVSGAWCSSDAHRRNAAASILKTGDAVALTALNGRPAVAGVAGVAIDALSSLRAGARPALSERTVPGELVVAFAPAQEPDALAAAASFTGGFALSASRWAQLDARLGQIPEPRVPTAISSAALRVASHARSARLASRRRAG